MSTVCYCGQPTCPVTEWNPGACINAAQAEVTALRARVAELEAQASCCRLCDAAEAEVERDEWKAKAEAAEAEVRGLTVKLDHAHAPCHGHGLGCGQCPACVDDWKARAQEAEFAAAQWKLKTGVVEAERDMALKRAEESAASAERLREAVVAFRQGVARFWSQSGDTEFAYPFSDARLDAALSTPAPAWLRERDRALAMRVAKVVAAEALIARYGRLHSDSLAAIVAEVVP